MRALLPVALLLATAACKLLSPPPQAIDRLQPCKMDQGPTDAYCGKLAVFENRQTRQGRKIDLKIVVLPALRRDPKPDPIFFFAGGPGQGAAKISRLLGLMFRRFQNDRDLVFIDQRGTGDSHPLNCEMVDKGQEKDDLLELTPAAIEARYRQCLAKYDADPRLYTTPIAMDDIDDVRQHLGYPQINLWGGSYGTRAALVYLRRHEAHVRTVTLDGVAPPDMKLPLYMARDSQRALDLLLDDCAKNAACNAKYPDLRRSLAAVLAQADRRNTVRVNHPRTGEKLNLPLSPEAVRGVIFTTLYQPSVATLLPRLLHEAAQGDFQGLLALATLSDGDTATSGMALGMFLSVACAEDMPRITAAEIDQESARTFFGRTMFDLRMRACDFWPKGEIQADYYQPIVSTKPALLLSGAADPVTPPTWAEHVKPHLKNSRHIVVPGAGHGVSSLGCIPILMAKFLNEANPAALNDACVTRQHRPPFFVNSSGPNTAASGGAK